MCVSSRRCAAQNPAPVLKLLPSAEEMIALIKSAIDDK
jgi:hypothetical protein